MADRTITAPAGEWTFISSGNESFQVISDRNVYFTEADEVPTETPPNDEPSNIAVAREIYNHRPSNERTNLYVYPEGGQATNIAVGSPSYMDSFTQDQTTPPLDLYFVQALAAPTQLAVATNIDDTSITVVDDTNFSVGDYIGVFCATAGRFYFGIVLAVVANVIDLDTPLDYAFVAGDNVVPFTRELNVDGSTTIQRFVIAGAGAGSPLVIDINRLMIQMYTDAVPQLNRFGDIVGGLDKGLVLRRNNGFAFNIWNVKDNGEFAHLSYDLDIYLSTNPAQGQNGLACRYTFNGQDKHGVTVRLKPGEFLELLVQDDLSSLERFRVLGEGSIVD